MGPLLVHHHLGLGDHFVCNGLVNHLAERHDRIYLPCKRQHVTTVRCLYADEPRVDVFPVDDESTDVEAFARATGCPVLRVGFEHCDPELFDRSFYRQLDVPFEYRYTKFRLPRVVPHEDEISERFAPPGGYCLVHRESSGGIYTLTIRTPLPLVFVERRTDPFQNLLGYRSLIRRATEIHCINSSVLHLVDGIDPDARLVYHDVRTRNFSIRQRWAIVEYATTPLARSCRGAVARARLTRERARSRKGAV
jgi:hypothetical protein